jgi:glycosyltransferase involved in cell wall biosynthesis
MRIMHISTRLILGGSQENTVLSCEGQASRGHAVSLVHGPIYGPEGSLLERVKSFRAGEAHAGREHPHPSPLPGGEGGRGIELIETPHLIRAIHPLRDALCYRDLRRLIRVWKPDVVHTHSSKAGILGRAAAWKERVPCVVHTIHGLPFHPYQSKVINAVYIAAERYAARRCHGIICVADAMRDQALAARVGRPEQYVTVYSGIEVEPFLNPRWSRSQVRRELGLSEDDFVIGTVSRLAELKGHDDLLDALGDTIRAKPGVKLLWVGDGWRRPRLMKRVEDMQLRGRVITTGLVPPEEVPKHLIAMDAMAHPSYREGLPRAVVQGMLSGLPVVAYDVDGTKEVCIEGVTGRLVRPGDRRSLREAVLWMMEHRDEARNMGRRGRERCRGQFAASTMVERLEEVYASVLGTAAGDAGDMGDNHGRGADV